MSAAFAQLSFIVDGCFLAVDNNFVGEKRSCEPFGRRMPIYWAEKHLFFRRARDRESYREAVMDGAQEYSAGNIVPASTPRTSHIRGIQKWNQVLGQAFGAIHADVKRGSDLTANIQSQTVGDISLYRCTASPSRVFHSIRQKSSNDSLRFHIKTQVRGRSRLFCHNARLDLYEGDYIICDNDRAYSIEFDDEHTIVSIPVSTSFLNKFTPFPKAVSFVKPRAENPIRKIASAYLESLWNCGPGSVSEYAKGRIAASYLELIILSLTDGRCEETRPSHGHGLFERCCQYIESTFRDETITPQSIADHLGVSLRHLQIRFASRGYTIMHYINQRRLEEGRKLLECSRYKNHSVSEIAYAVGFKSHAHFSRAFKDVFSCSPSVFRS
ncbi:MAG TPA: AraC family transcriptional regulator [Alphaproteobacteria bacterium]|nr:AraC family transcriptional regulator [Alphaproteobacteria bacterium]